MVDHFVFFGVVAEHQAEVLGGVRLVVVAGADDGRYTRRQIFVQLGEEAVELLGCTRRLDLVPHLADLEAEGLEGGDHLPGMGPASRGGGHARKSKNIILGGQHAPVAQGHLSACLATEIRPLLDVGHPCDLH